MRGRTADKLTWRQIVELYPLAEPAVTPNDLVSRLNASPNQIEAGR